MAGFAVGRAVANFANAAAPLWGTAAVLAAWWGATASGMVQGFLLPVPASVVAELAGGGGRLLLHTRVTALEITLGFLIAAGFGVAAGSMMAYFEIVAAALWPTLVALHSIPKMALGSMLLVWLGFGITPKVVMVTLVCVFPVVLATSTALRHVDTALIELARSMSASRWQTFVKIRFPHALPQIFHGLQQAAPLAVIGAVVAELFGATAGLGYAISIAGTDMPAVYAHLVVLAAMSITLFYSLGALQRRLLSWVQATTS